MATSCEHCLIHLTSYGRTFPSRSIRWLNSTYTLRHRSLELEQSGELEKSYVLLVRAATLLLEYIPKHPEFDRTLNVQERGQLVQTGQGYLRDLARLKKVLEDQARLGVPVQRPVKSVDQAAEQQKNTFSQHPTPPSFGDLRRLGSPQTSQSRSHERRSSTQALPNTQYSSQPKASKRPDGEVEWDDGIPRRGQADEHRWEGGAYEDRGRGRERSGSGGIGTGGHQAELANYLTKMRLSPAPSLTSLGPSHGSDTQGLSHGDRPGSRAASSQDLTTPYLPSSGRFPSPTQAPTNHPAQQHQHPQYLLPNPSGYYSSTPPPIAPTYYRHPSPNQPPSSHTQQHAPLPYPYPSSSEHPSFSERMPTHIPKSASTSHLNIEYPSMPDPKDYQPMRDGYVPSFTNRAVVEQEGYGGYPSAGTGSGPGSGSGSGSHQYDAVPGPSTATRPVPPHSAWHEYYDYPHPGHHHLSPSPSEPAIDRLPLGLGMPLPVVVVNKPKGRPPEAPGRPSSSTSTSTPTSTTLQPTRPLHKPSSGLRRMRVPKSLLPSFLHIAYPNTKKKIETCGLLLGTVQVRYGAVQELVVEVLLIPKQKGTSDTCQMEEEEGVVTVQLEKGLDALGWVSLNFWVIRATLSVSPHE